ncbi:MAG: hypothetical protein PUF12_08240 [Thermoflexaceae bacterium]|nr:hypothetical protein [Thermoflexaceae bacterium]
MVVDVIKKELDELFEMSLPEQTECIANKLVEAGIKPTIYSTAYTSNTIYEVGDYVLIDINPARFPMRRTPCILDASEYKNLKGLRFRNECRDLKIGGEYHKLPKVTVSPVFIGNRKESNVKVYRYILKAPKGIPVDHVFKSVVINTHEALALSNTADNLRNRKCTRYLTDEEIKANKERDFSNTWYIYVYWRMLGLISQEDAFAYNLEKNQDK